MSMSNKAIFPQAVLGGKAVLTAAKTTYNDTANAVLVLTAGENGALITDIRVIPRATCTATQVQIYISYDSGLTLDLYETVFLPATTISSTAAITMVKFTATASIPWLLPAHARLYAAIGVALAGGIEVIAQGMDY